MEIIDQELLSLDLLGLKSGTDKSSKEHNYLSFYEFFFEKIRHAQIKILEIGVLVGASLKVWEEYFPNGIVIGADIDPGIKSLGTSRILTEIIDQSNIEDLVQLGVNHGPFDVVIEDGSHQWEHQITTFKTLFPFLKNGGIYIVEDLHTNYGNLSDQFRGTSTISCVEYLKKLVDLRVADDQINILNEEDPFLRTYGRNIQSLTFYRRACILRKDYRANPYRILRLTPGSESHDIADTTLTDMYHSDVLGISIVCHVGEIGNRKSSSGAIRILRDDANIQGFTIFCEDLLSNELEYRARLMDGSWTEWVTCGQFVGTMGKSQDLTGFSARLTGLSNEIYNVDLFGLFRGLEDPVVVAAGDECICPADGNALYGMQIIIRSKLDS